MDSNKYTDYYQKFYDKYNQANGTSGIGSNNKSNNTNIVNTNMTAPNCDINKIPNIIGSVSPLKLRIFNSQLSFSLLPTEYPSSNNSLLFCEIFSHPIKSVLLLFDDIEGGINNTSLEFPSKEWVERYS